MRYRRDANDPFPTTAAIVVIGCLFTTLAHFGEDTMRRETVAPKIARAAR